jgi:hypothetical protein
VDYLGDLGDEHVVPCAPAGDMRVTALATSKRSNALKVCEHLAPAAVMRAQPDSVDRYRPTATAETLPPHPRYPIGIPVSLGQAPYQDPRAAASWDLRDQPTHP